MNSKNWIIWGAGQIGRGICRLLKKKNKNVLAIIDSNTAIQGEDIEGIAIYDKAKLVEFDEYCVCVSVDGKYAEISEILMCEYKISKAQIFDYMKVVNKLYFQDVDISYRWKNKKKSVIFLCDGGLGLGGVETWCLTFGKELKKRKINVKYMIPSEDGDEHDDDIIPIKGESFFDFGCPDIFYKLVQELINNIPCTVVVNYKFLGYLAACVVKKAFRNNIKIVSVVHGGKQPIFDWNVLYKDYVDQYIGVSKYGICDQLVKSGIEEDKITHIVCPVPIDNELKREYSPEDTPIKLAYAGRLTLTDKDKRVDLLIPLIEGLEKEKLDYIFKIAGEGDFKQYLEQYVFDNNLEGKIEICGLLGRDKMEMFWVESDIFVNVSDSEGNCMAMLEAMSQGCVPVLTDVSGVRDSIKNNYNGFIVERGDMKTMVEKIKYLDSNRNLLIEFGKRIHSKMVDIYRDNKMIDKFEKVVSVNL